MSSNSTSPSLTGRRSDDSVARATAFGDVISVLAATSSGCEPHRAGERLVLLMGVPARASTRLSISSRPLLPRSPPTLENDTARLDEFEERRERVFVFRRSNGIKKTNCEPTPGFESTRNWPRSWPIMCATTANPRPSEGSVILVFIRRRGQPYIPSPVEL